MLSKKKPENFTFGDRLAITAKNWRIHILEIHRR